MILCIFHLILFLNQGIFLFEDLGSGIKLSFTKTFNKPGCQTILEEHGLLKGSRKNVLKSLKCSPNHSFLPEYKAKLSVPLVLPPRKVKLCDQVLANRMWTENT